MLRDLMLEILAYSLYTFSYSRLSVDLLNNSFMPEGRTKFFPKGQKIADLQSGGFFLNHITCHAKSDFKASYD